MNPETILGINSWRQFTCDATYHDAGTINHVGAWKLRISPTIAQRKGNDKIPVPHEDPHFLFHCRLERNQERIGLEGKITWGYLRIEMFDDSRITTAYSRHFTVNEIHDTLTQYLAENPNGPGPRGIIETREQFLRHGFTETSHEV